MLASMSDGGSAPRATAAPAAATDALQQLLTSLRQPPPGQTAFVELRWSGLLAEPLRLSGELQHPAADTLVRRVDTPYRERTTIAGGRVEVVREAGAGGAASTRRFSLRQAPELGGLLVSFSALLDGDRSQLERNYTAVLDAGAARWTLRLTPRDAGLRRRVASVTLHGSSVAQGGAQLQCMQLIEADGDRTITLLGAAAAAAAQIQAADALSALCLRGAATPGRNDAQSRPRSASGWRPTGGSRAR